jgi:glutathione synthase
MLNNRIIVIQADAIEKINPLTDTTLLLAQEAQKRKYQIYWFEPKDLSLIGKKLLAKVKKIKFLKDKKKFYTVEKQKRFDISKAKFILIRQNPPFGMNYFNSTLLLDYVKNKTKIINDPESIRNTSEKLFSLNFIDLMPPTIFTKSFDEIQKFFLKYKNIVIKPVNGYGGKGILFIKKLNKKFIKNYLKKSEHIMVQKFLPSIKKGDKRVFIINGKVKGAIRRIPKKKSNLSNLGQGGKAYKTMLNKKEKQISILVAKKLKKANIYFAGIDLVSNRLIGDINITSPTGLKQYEVLNKVNLAKDFWDGLNLK